MIKATTTTLACSQYENLQNPCPTECARRSRGDDEHDVARLESRDSFVHEENQTYSFNLQSHRLSSSNPRSQTLVEDAQHLCWDNFSYITEDSSTSEYFVKDIRIFTRARDEWEVARATFDTASTYNWISKSFVEDRLGLPVSKIPAGTVRTCVAFSGHVVIPVGFVRLVWYKIEGAGRTTYETQFLVCDQANNFFDVVVGSRTIAREKILLWKIATVWSHHEIRMPHQTKKERLEEEERKQQTALNNDEYQNRVKRAKANRYQRLALEAQIGSARPSRETSSLRQEDQRPPLALALQRQQQAEVRIDNIRLNYGKRKEIIPGTARTSMSDAAKAAQESWQSRYPAEAGRTRALATGAQPSQDSMGGAMQSPPANLGRANAQAAGSSEGPAGTGLLPKSLEQRGDGAGVIDSGSSRGHFSQDPLTRSTDGSRNAMSTPATSTEVHLSDQEHQANEAIRQEVPESSKRRDWRRFWRRRRQTQNGTL